MATWVYMAQNLATEVYTIHNITTGIYMDQNLDGKGIDELNF